MRQVAVVTAHDAPYRELASVTYPVLEAYCKRHDYNLWYQDDIPAIEKDLCKSRIFGEIFREERFAPDDLFLWIDSDAAPLNHAIKVEDVWDAHADENTHFLWSYNFDGPNSGIFMARFSEQADNFIRAYAYEQAAMGWGDNNAMNLKMMLPPFRDWVKCIPGIYMNSGPYEEYGLSRRPREWKRSVNGYEPGDWILHAAGIEEPRRTEVLKKYISMLIDVQPMVAPAGIPDADITNAPGSVVPFIDISPVPPWVTLRGLEEALQTPRGLHESVDWGVWNAVYCNNEYEIGDFAPEDVVIDIGMQTASFTCYAYARGSRNILGYEADSGTFGVAEKNVAHLGAGYDVQIFNRAVIGNDQRGKNFFFVPDSMLTNTEGVGQPIPTVAFDDILAPLKRVRYLKIDCEGGEWPILYSSTQLHKIQEIGGEYHPNANIPGADAESLREFLALKGFQVRLQKGDGEIGNVWAWRS